MTTATTKPDRSLEQRLEALERANYVRSRRSQLKRDLKHGHCSLLDVLASPPEYAQTMRIDALLIAAPKAGPVKAGKWLRQLGISPSRSIGDLSIARRAQLAALLGGRR